MMLSAVSSRIILSALLVIAAGCSSVAKNPSAKSSDTYLWEESDALSTAPGQAFAADSMHFRKPMPDRRSYREWEFYFKHCVVNGTDAYFQKTQYSCTRPN